jgi:hypothetical protein
VGGALAGGGGGGEHPRERAVLEAQLGMRVEDIWDSLDKQGQLSRSGKLNSCFDSIPIASFLHTFIGDQLVEIPSDATLVEVVDILSRNLIKLGSYQILE